ncbi:hypothetical protein DSM112329_02936 [Paraconexibacter sp. AEG42_29]|uniref:Transglycosylase SLT domain-containing protein n=1 Tax=Paraconexibacter sp. AEG42_29 TaxID=2997339 RepID=A0AAU7AWS3_9ACTN
MSDRQDDRRQVPWTLLLLGGSSTLIAAAIAALIAIVLLLLLGGKSIADQQACTPGSPASSPAAMSTVGRGSIPAQFIPLYVASAERFGLGPEGWLWLAAIHKVETDQNRNVNTSSAGAQGPMQFMPGTWAAYGIDADGDGRADIQNTADAIHSAGKYLAASGAPGDWHKAVFAYNHAEWYYQRVLRHQTAYRGTGQDPAPDAVALPAQGAATTPASEAPQTGAALDIARTRQGQVAYAVADAQGQIITAERGDQAFPSASLTKAMLLVARLRRLSTRPIPAAVTAQLEPMITRSDNTAANRIWAQLTRKDLLELARAAGMQRFQLRTDDPVYRLGNSRITAADQARFFAQLGTLIPAPHRTYALRLLARIVPAQRWGIWDAGIPEPISGKGGWRPDPGGFTTNQAAQISLAGQVRGIAILTQGPGESYGHETIRLIAQALAAANPTGVQAAPGSDCAPAGALSTGGDIATVAGPRAQLTPDGKAVAPQEAPAQVKAILAAGNRIVGRPYVYGGGHGPPLTTAVAAYDCSSAISYILHQAGLFPSTTAWVSGTFARQYGQPGAGTWVTLQANDGHIYMYVAGLRWDTHRWGAADRGVPGNGWHTAQRPDTGFTARHPPGL